MQNIQLGPFLLNGSLVLNLLFGAGGWIMLKLWGRIVTDRSETKTIAELLSNGFLLWLLIWKFSYLLIHPVEAVSKPMSLLYFDGGEAGGWIAGLVGGLYIWLRSRKKELHFAIVVHGFAVYFLGGWFVSRLPELMFQEGPSISWIASICWTGILLLQMLIAKRETPEARIHFAALWFLIGNIVFQFFNHERVIWILSFSKLQVLFLLLAGVLVFWKGPKRD